MYRPNFCSECGKKIIRLRWRPWSSRRFCDACSTSLRKARLRGPLIGAVICLTIGWATGRAMRPAPPPLIIQRVAAPPVIKTDGEVTPTAAASSLVNEEIYSCGARTRKGAPCSRRVPGLVRCWQHKGMPAMLAPEKLRIKE